MKTRPLALFAAALALTAFLFAGTASAAVTSGADDTLRSPTACDTCGCKKKHDGGCEKGGDCKGDCRKCDGDCKGDCGKKGGCDKCDECGECGGHGKDAAKAPKAFDAPPAVGTKATCPVMGGEFTVTETTQRSEHDGKHYVFCCPGCKPKFDADPAKYAAK